MGKRRHTGAYTTMLRICGVGLALCTTAGCSASQDFVELRLVPCELDADPQSVRLEIQQYDIDGAAVGDPLREAYNLADDTLDDGVATVGYKPGPGVTAADFTIWWYVTAPVGSPDEADALIALPGLRVPAIGTSLELTLPQCATMGGTGTGGGSVGTIGDGTTTSGTGTGTTTGTGTSSTTTPLTSGSTGDDTGDTTGGPGGPTMVGMPCGNEGVPFCEPRPDAAGWLLLCSGGMWVEDDSTCNAVCVGMTPVVVGCVPNAGMGSAFQCLCQSTTPQACSPADEGCSGMGGSVTVCLDGEIARAGCPNSTCDFQSPTEITCD